MKRKTLLSLILPIFFLSGNSFAEQDSKHKLTFDKIDSSRFYDYAILQILDKTTAKTSILRIKTGEQEIFGRINIAVSKCWQAPLDQKPDSRILMKISETNNTDYINNTGSQKDESAENSPIFHGWMIASSPSISGLEHPVYDVVALNCEKEEKSE